MEMLVPDIGLVVFTIIGFALLAVWVLTIVDVYKGDFRSPSERPLWLLLVLFAPFIGIILYMLIGRRNKINYN
jgi:hypothetical protein